MNFICLIYVYPSYILKHSNPQGFIVSLHSFDLRPLVITHHYISYQPNLKTYFASTDSEKQYKNWDLSKTISSENIKASPQILIHPIVRRHGGNYHVQLAQDAPDIRFTLFSVYPPPLPPPRQASRLVGSSEPCGARGHGSLCFSISVIPISTRGPDYAHHITIYPFG